jgi:hypothetical protein
VAEISIERSKTLVAIVGGLVATGLIGLLVFSMGGWAYHHRGGTLHDGRLRRAVALHPTSDQITQALLAEEGTRTLVPPASEAEWRALAAQWPRTHLEDILDLRRRWREVRLFAVPGDTVYVLFFDGDGKLQDYALMSR